MVLPISLYGDEVLRRRAKPVEEDSEALQSLIDDMIETMHGASGIGLAAPQVGRPLRLFVIDLTPMASVADEPGEDEFEIPEDFMDGPHVFINPEIMGSAPNLVSYEEGCLSIPGVRDEVSRPDVIRIRYYDRNFNEHELEAPDLLARVIQHELDHLNGVLFIDRITPFRRRLLRRRLREISRGDVDTDYPVRLGEIESDTTV